MLDPLVWLQPKQLLQCVHIHARVPNSILPDLHSGGFCDPDWRATLLSFLVTDKGCQQLLYSRLHDSLPCLLRRGSDTFIQRLS